MTRVDPGRGNIVLPAAPNGTIKLDPQFWASASVAIQVSNDPVKSLAAGTMVVVNGALDALNMLTFIEGAVAAAQAVSDWSSKVILGVGCIAGDFEVVTSGLTAAAAAFASLDSTLATTIANLELQLPSYTTETTLMSDGVASATPLQILGPQRSPGDGGLSVSPTVVKALGITAVGAGAACGLAATGAGSALLELLAGLALAAV